MKRGGPLPARSPQRADEDDDYQQLRIDIIGQPCQVCQPMIAAATAMDIDIGLVCDGPATEPHHLRKLSSAGARTNPANVVASCRTGNLAVEDWPGVAEAAGLVVRPQHKERWDQLSARAWRDHLRDLRASDPPGQAPTTAKVLARPPAGPDPF